MIIPIINRGDMSSTVCFVPRIRNKMSIYVIDKGNNIRL